MIYVGINGFGRIGKCIFLQLLSHPDVIISCINAPVLEMKFLEQYLKYDSVHKYSTQFNIQIIDDETFEIDFNNRKQTIHIFRNRQAQQLNWRHYNVSFVFDCTGSYLTTEKCMEHDADFVMMSAPAKDSTKTFVYGVNHNEYNGEKIISSASCTTNCITPVLKWIDEELDGIICGNFTTIHATTASQYTVDILNKNARTNRSILNNIIPHTTGASSAIASVIPNLKGKIHGTSLRVPVSNVSLVDLNIECNRKDLSLTQLLEKMKNINDERTDVITVTKDTLVSCDFISTTHPSIVDSKASLDLGDGKYKLMIWYDNEWSYSAQMIRMMKHMISYGKTANKKFDLKNLDLMGKNVILRVDYNVPILNGEITDDFRIVSTLPTIKTILEKGANRIILVSHLGRPKTRNQKDSLQILIPRLEELLGESIGFIPDFRIEDGTETSNQTSKRIYLMENIRFYREEMEFEEKGYENISIDFANSFNNLGDVFINDAFGCSHRKHYSICGYQGEHIGYGHLIEKELYAFEEILNAKEEGKKVLMILGGSKIDDKVPILNSLCKKVETIYLGGGIITNTIEGMNQINKTAIENAGEYCNVVWARDGINQDNSNIIWNDVSELDRNTKIYDVGMSSISDLMRLIYSHDIILWNGTMGWVEREEYKRGSEMLMEILLVSNKKVIVGGGDTAGFCGKWKERIPEFWHISTGGGASIEYLGNGGNLVGLERFK